jgi:hypothetical protein
MARSEDGVRLPAPLAPWASQLAIFPADVAIALGPAIRRLSAAIGGWPAHPEGDSGDPDGFDGLSRRGSYERLLVSEWLLADEWPEEFLRRAGMGEHTFLRLARPQPSAHRHSVVLFDVGPSQIGGPRIVHIAALIVLARRAALARASFTWGILQQPPESDGAEITPKSLRGLLNARSRLEPTDAALAHWHDHIVRRWQARDVWIVGAPRWESRAAAHTWSSLSVRDVYDLAARQLAVTVRGPKRTPAHVTLALPAPDVSTRLLRNPTGHAPLASTLSDAGPVTTGDVTFSANGHRLIVRSPDGAVWIYVVPTSLNEKPRLPITLPPTAGLVIGANHWAGRLVLVRQAERLITLDQYSRRGGRQCGTSVYRGDASVGAPAPGARPFPLTAVVRVGRDYFVRDAVGALRRLAGSEVAEHQLVAARVAALGATAAGLFFVEDPYGHGPWQGVSLGVASRSSFVLSEAAHIEAHVAHDFSDSRRYPAVAVSEDGKTFQIWQEGATQSVSTFGGRAIGLFPDRNGRLGLVVVDSQPARLAQLGPGWTRKLQDPPAYSAAVAFCPMSGRIAFVSEQGTLSVFSVRRDTMIAHWHSAGIHRR